MSTTAPPTTVPDLVAAARTGRRVTHPALMVVLTLAFVLVPAIASSVLVRRDGSATGQFLGLVTAFAPMILLVWLWVARYEGRRFWTLGFTRRHAGRRLVIGFAVGAAGYAVIVGALAAVGIIERQPGPAGLQGTAALGGVLLVGVAYLLQGAAEEIVFRGWLLPTVAARTRVAVGLVVSVVLWDLLHLLGNAPHAVYYVNLTLVGVLLAVWALRDGSLWAVWGWHVAQNWSIGNWWGLDAADSATPGGALVDLTVGSRAEWLTGGLRGLDHGLATTLFLVVLLLVLSRRRHRRGHRE